MRTVTVLAASLLLLGCERGMMDRAVGKMVQEGRGRGEKLLATPKEVATDPVCLAQKQSGAYLESIEANPNLVKPGESFNFRFVYLVCPTTQNRPIKGALTTSITYQGTAIHSDRLPAFELRPGRWAVDNDIVVPAEAPAGMYYVSASFAARRARFDDQVRFEVF